MDTYSDHLDVVNSVLSLAYNLESYPNHLFKAGYSISRIEPRFNVNGTLNPDILFTSPNRGLLCECKSGGQHIGPNLHRYSEITTRHLIEKGIDILKEPFILDVGIFGKRNLELLKDRLKKDGINYPQVMIDEIIQRRYGDNFKDKKLKTFFNEPVAVYGQPLNILKFSVDRSDKKIAPFIFNSLIAWSVLGRKTFTPRELAENSIDTLWNSMDTKLQQALTKKIKNFLRYCKSRELSAYLQNRDDVWTIEINDHWKSRKRFSEDCDKLIENLAQVSIWEYISNGDES